MVRNAAFIDVLGTQLWLPSIARFLPSSIWTLAQNVSEPDQSGAGEGAGGSRREQMRAGTEQERADGEQKWSKKDDMCSSSRAKQEPAQCHMKS